MNEQVEKYVAPVRELNQLAIANVEKIMDLQIQRLQENTKIGVEQMKTASQIADFDGLKDYMNTCTDVARKMSERAVEDARAVFEMGNAYTNEAQRIFKGSLSTD